MSFFESRRPQPHARGTTLLCGLACLLLCACTNGKGSPIIEVGVADSGAFGSSVAGTSARADAGARDDEQIEEPPLSPECKRTDSAWPTAYASDERKLLDRIDQIRANPSMLCPSYFTPLQPLETDRALQCTARLRIVNEQAPRGPSNGPSFFLTYNTPRSQDQGMLHEREKSANSRIDGEVIFSNVNSVDGIIQTLKADPEDTGSFCLIAVSPALPFVGAARVGPLWVLDFRSSAAFGPRVPGTGNPGPGNSGTGGR